MKRPILFFSFACVMAAGHLHANGGGYSKGMVSTSSFQPIGVDQVEMVSEHLEIDLHLEYAEIRVEYVLHNPGKKITVECGFPAVFDEGGMFAPLPAGAPREPREPKTLEGFRFEADGKEIKVRVHGDDAAADQGPMRLTSWHVVKIPFAAGQTRRVKASYRNPYHCDFHSVSDDWSDGSPNLRYAFSAAALWTGPIKHGVVIINARSVNPAKVQLSHPKRYQYENGSWKWSFTDFEPTLEDDLVISTRPLWTGMHGGYLKEGGDEKGKGGQWYAYSKFTSSASSMLKEPDGTEHAASNVSDGDRKSAWVEGVGGDGVGESVTLTLNKPGKAHCMGIVNGYTKSRELFFANSRVKQLLVSVNGGKPEAVELPDEYLVNERFWFDVPKSKELVKTIRLEIASVYPGTTYKDTAISSINVLHRLDKEPKIEPSR